MQKQYAIMDGINVKTNTIYDSLLSQIYKACNEYLRFFSMHAYLSQGFGVGYLDALICVQEKP